MPWEDISGSLAVIGISTLLAFNFQAHGRHGYKTGFYWSLGNLAISLGAVVGEFGTVIGGWWAVPYFFTLSSVAYFATLGALVTFNFPKKVKCFRCQYVDFPHETDDELSRHEESEWRAFRSMDAETKKIRNSHD